TTPSGTVLGTIGYMSPEQVRGRSADVRSDLFAFGAVLYEMLAGQPPHIGGAAQQVIMRIITEPARPVTEFRKSVPANVDAALARALEKLPADRFESAKAFADALGSPSYTRGSSMGGPSRTAASPWSRATIAFAVASAVLGAALAASVFSQSRAPAPAQPVRFAITDDDSLQVESGSTRPFAISPDGRSIVFRASHDSGGPHLWLRTLDDPLPRRIEGSLDGMNPAFSADGEWIAFINENVFIKKVRVNGGTVTPVVRSVRRVAALAWGEKDEIFFEQIGPPAGIQRISGNAGRQEVAVPMDSANKEVQQRRPLYIRGAGVIAYGSTGADIAEPTLVFYRLADGRRFRSEIPGIGPLAMLGDLLVYSRATGTLMAVKIDAKAMKVIGTPVALEPRVVAAGTGTAAALSERGTLVYRSAGDVGGSTLALVDMNGAVRPLRGRFAMDTPMRFSPDGKRVVISARYDDTGPAIEEQVKSTHDVKVLDLATQVTTRVRSRGDDKWMSWAFGGQRLVSQVVRNDSTELWAMPLDGSAESRLVEFGGQVLESTSVAPDGKAYIVMAFLKPPSGSSMLRVWVDGTGRVDTLLVSGRSHTRPSLVRYSPDGRLVAFLDRNSGDVHVLDLSSRGTLQVSEVAASYMRPVVWGPDSRHLYYVAPNGLTVVELESSPALHVVRRTVNAAFPNARNYDLSPDGKTFVMVNPSERGEGVHVAVNWGDEVRRLWIAGQK
ncbi:MAG: protein kinase, partial [Gemmatimonadales bacterium]